MEENDYDYEVHADVGDSEHEEESSSAASYFALSGVPPSIPFTSSSATSVQSAAASIPPLPRPPASLGQPAEISAAPSQPLPMFVLGKIDCICITEKYTIHGL